MEMTQQQWKKICDCYDQLIDLPSARQEERLDALVGDDELLREEVLKLLDGTQAASHFFTELEVSMGRAMEELIQVDGNGGRFAEGQQVGAYEIVREIGEGGMSKVYLAKRADGEFDRTIALKVMKNLSLDETATQLFAQEKRLHASLLHPHIAVLYESGTATTGQPYVAMEYVEGQPIDQWCAEKKYDAPHLGGLIGQLLDALAFAHQKLIVHQDIKPGNVLITTEDQVKLLDFGIASVGQQGHQAVGFTRRFAAPEQWHKQEVSVQTDIYQAGLLWLYLLSGQYGLPSIMADDWENILANRNRALQGLEKHFPKDFTAILQKALAEKPSDRYASTTQFAEDIQRFYQGGVVRAFNGGKGYQLKKLIGRHKVAVSLSFLLLISLLGGLLATTNLYLKAEEEREKATTISGFLTDFFTAPNPYQENGNEITVQQLVLDQMEKIEGLSERPSIQYEVYGMVYTLLERLQMNREADSIARLKRPIGQQLFADETERGINAIRDLGWMATLNGNYEKADIHYQEASDLTESEYPGNSLQTSLWIEWAMGQGYAFNYAKADSLYRLAYVQALATKPMDTVQVIQAGAGLGNLWQEQYKPQEGLAYVEKAYELFQLKYPDYTARNGMALPDMADVFAAAGKPELAIEIYGELAGKFKDQLGLGNPTTQSIFNNYALILSRQADEGQRRQAADIFRELVVLRESKAEGSPLDLAQTYQNYGGILRKSGMVDSAIVYYQRAYVQYEKANPNGGFYQNAFPKMSLSSIYLKAGQPQKTVENARVALEVLQKHLGNEQAIVGDGHYLLAAGLVGSGRKREALRHIEEALAIFKNAMGEESEKYQNTLKLRDGE